MLLLPILKIIIIIEKKLLNKFDILNKMNFCSIKNKLYLKTKIGYVFCIVYYEKQSEIRIKFLLILSRLSTL